MAHSSAAQWQREPRHPIAARPERSGGRHQHAANNRSDQTAYDGGQAVSHGQFAASLSPPDFVAGVEEASEPNDEQRDAAKYQRVSKVMQVGQRSARRPCRLESESNWTSNPVRELAGAALSPGATVRHDQDDRCQVRPAVMTSAPGLDPTPVKPTSTGFNSTWPVPS